MPAATTFQLAVVTMSEEGSMVVADGRRTRIPAAKVDKIVDLTGAGDLYASGFLYGLSRGFPLRGLRPPRLAGGSRGHLHMSARGR